MKMTAQQLDAIRARVADGTADDDDRRLADLYANTDVNSEPEQVAQTATVVGRADAEVIKPKKAAPRKAAR